MAELSFDATQIDPSQQFEAIPPGKYKVQIVASEMRPTKDGNGQYLWLEQEILEGEYQGRRLWDRLNLANANAQAVEIAQRTLSALCHAVGELHVADSEQLHFKPLIATVRVRAARDGYDASNEIRGYESAGTVAAKPAAQNTPLGTTQEQAAVKPAASKAPPWRTAKKSA
jgi:hypothetical protein